MNEAERRLLELLEKFHNATADEEELAELDRWFDSFDDHPKLSSGLDEGRLSEMKREMLRNIYKELKVEPKKSRRGIPLRAIILTSVCICLLIAGGLILWRTNRFSKNEIKADIMPGRTVAILTLSDGHKIDLNKVKPGIIASQPGLEIRKALKGQIVYRIINRALLSNQNINTLTTPAGGQFEVILSDGSHIWLNAMSSLIYHETFSGTNRTVALKGEGYFEIAKDKLHPFVVNTAKEAVQVLGTHFNISAYEDEKTQRTTLLEGSVRVSSRLMNGQQITIKPGQQAEGNNEQLAVKEVDADEAVGWKNGLFILNHTELHDLMRQLSRWYDIDVVYKGRFKPRFFSGEIDRTYTLREVLKVLTLRKINFEIKTSASKPERSQLILTP